MSSSRRFGLTLFVTIGAVKLYKPPDAANHNFAYRIRPLPVRHLKAADYTVSVKAETPHHGVEVCWPGPGLTVRYKSTP